MKKTIIICVLFLFGLKINAQIGINTNNPQALFHLDARASLSTSNPSSGIPNLIQQSDDIVITDEGKLGIGVIDPSSKVEINTRNTGAYALQLKDGGEATAKLLVSDSDGFASWGTIRPPSGAVYPIQIIPVVTLPKGKQTKLQGSEFTAPHDGFFSYEVRWWSEYTGSNAVAARTVTILQLRKNDVIMDEFQYNTPFNKASITTYIPFYTKALKNDVLSLWVYPKEAPGDIKTSHLRDWTKTKVLIKELQID